MPTHTDLQLKQLLAKMLPEKVHFHESSITKLWWKEDNGYMVKDTELLQLCWEVEERLIGVGKFEYYELLDKQTQFITPHATWQQRTKALAKVLEVEI